MDERRDSGTRGVQRKKTPPGLMRERRSVVVATGNTLFRVSLCQPGYDLSSWHLFPLCHNLSQSATRAFLLDFFLLYSFPLHHRISAVGLWQCFPLVAVLGIAGFVFFSRCFYPK